MESTKKDIIDLSAARAMGCLEFLLSTINTMTNEAGNKKGLSPSLLPSHELEINLQKL